MVYIIGIFILIEFAGNGVSGGVNRSSNIFDTFTRSDSAEIVSDRSSTTTASQKSHSDLIRTCSTFHEILSEDVTNSCDYSMLYYKGQCELYSDLLKQNETEAILKAKNDLSFCSDSRLDTYIHEHDLTNAPRSPTLIPNEGIQWLKNQVKRKKTSLALDNFFPIDAHYTFSRLPLGSGPLIR